MSRENPEQIPDSQNADETRKAVKRQQDVPGESRDQSVSSFPEAAALGQALKEVDFPADKQTIIRHIEESAQPGTREILPAIQKIEDKEYRNVAEIAEAARLVS